MQATIITGEDNIGLAKLCVLKSALKLEIVGLKRRGRSAYSMIKATFSLKGNKQSVLEQFEKIIEEKMKELSNK